MDARDYLTDQLYIAVSEDGGDADYIRDVGNALADVVGLETALDLYASEGVYVVVGDGGVHRFCRADFKHGDPLTKIAAITDAWEIRPEPEDDEAA